MPESREQNMPIKSINIKRARRTRANARRLCSLVLRIHRTCHYASGHLALLTIHGDATRHKSDQRVNPLLSVLRHFVEGRRARVSGVRERVRAGGAGVRAFCCRQAQYIKSTNKIYKPSNTKYMYILYTEHISHSSVRSDDEAPAHRSHSLCVYCVHISHVKQKVCVCVTMNRQYMCMYIVHTKY